MPDHMDVIQERCLREQEATVARIERQRSEGLDHCMDCGDFIHATRKALGARLCFECQTAVETKVRR